MKNNKVLITVLVILYCLLLIGTAYSAWIFTVVGNTRNNVQSIVPNWTFGVDSDFAKIENVKNCNYLTATKETSITCGSAEAVRFTNTAGTQTKTHSFNLSTDRDYTLSEIRFFKVEFDYHHSSKREQSNRGFPKVQLLYNNSSKGSDQGGTDTVNEKSPFICTEIDEDWWHLEYFITAMCPTMVDHGDTPIPLSQKINGIKITDSTIYDYNGTTAFIIIDNVSFSSAPTSRLGIFNRTSSLKVGGYFWVKVAWVGELQSVQFDFSNPAVAEYDTASTSSPFYIKGLSAGTTQVTVTITLNTGQVLSITTNTLTVTNN